MSCDCKKGKVSRVRRRGTRIEYDNATLIEWVGASCDVYVLGRSDGIEVGASVQEYDDTHNLPTGFLSWGELDVLRKKVSREKGKGSDG